MPLDPPPVRADTLLREIWGAVQTSYRFMGAEASAFSRQLVERKRVRLEYDVARKDRYGLTLAYVYVGRTFVNAELVRRGYAQLMTVPPNVRHADLFVALQRECREANRGLWNVDAAAKWDPQVAGESGAPDSDPTRP